MKWDGKKRVSELPHSIKEIFLSEAQYLYNELSKNILEVVLVPAPVRKHPYHMIRKVENRNPDWYQQLYSEYQHFRRDRSLNALERICNQEDMDFKHGQYKYDSIYRDLIYQRLTEGYDCQCGEVPPDDDVKGFFN